MKANITKNEIRGEVISSGIAKGILCFADFKGDTFFYKKRTLREDVPGEVSRFEQEVGVVINELKDSIKLLKKDLFFEEAEIIQTHILMLEDVEFRKRVHEKIKTNRLAAEIALEHVLQEMIAVLENSESMLFAQRAVDLKDIEMRLKNRLIKEDSAILSELLKNVNDPIVAVKELFPSMVLEARTRGVRGFIVRQGTAFSHAAILAKSFNLPVLRIENLYNLGIRAKENVLIDAINGKMLIDPTEEDTNYAAKLTQETHPALDEAPSPIKLWINIADPSQIEEGSLKDLEGIGLYRTEFLFMQNREDFPDENEQFAAYSLLFKKCKDYPVTIRTLDIGGDKTLPYFSLGAQQNPYLGFRAHRIYRFHPEIFVTQVKAILRAGLEIKRLRILYPMIETIDDLWFVQGLLEKAAHSLKKDGIKHKDDFQQGILIEVPSAVWNLKDLLHHVDFISIGTNDLFQYFFAVDRNNANVYNAYQPASPVALQMLKNIIDISAEFNKSVNICGEIASDINYLPLLAGLGFDNLSLDLHSIPAIKKRLLSLDIAECKKLAQHCLKAKRTDDVIVFLDKFNSCSQRIRRSCLRNSSELIDPICKMAVYADGNKWAHIRNGKKYYFCCKECRDKFMKLKGIKI